VVWVASARHQDAIEIGFHLLELSYCKRKSILGTHYNITSPYIHISIYPVARTAISPASEGQDVASAVRSLIDLYSRTDMPGLLQSTPVRS